MWNGEFSKLIPELSVSSYETSINFYIYSLGFKIDYAREKNKFAMISMNGAQMLIEEMNGNWETGKLEYPLGRGVNFQIEIENAEEMAERLKRGKMKLFREIEENWYRVNDKEYGNKEFLAQDPDGYLLRFSEDLGPRNIYGDLA
jgi:catechol 2,3-dioxygenase-like lactoylglutathione lyase family enzyme